MGNCHTTHAHPLSFSPARLAACLLACLVLACLAGMTGCAKSSGGSAANNAPRDTELMQYNYSNGTATPSEGTQAVGDDALDGSQEESANAEANHDADEATGEADAQNGELPARLAADIQALVDASGMQVGVSVVDLETGQRASIGGGQQMVAASMIKLVVAAAFLQQAEAGAFDLDGYYTLQAGDIVGGTGTLVGLGAGAQVSYRDILARMIDVSDNTGANILINAVGMDAVNAQAASMGLAATQLNRLMMDEAAISAGIENYTSADDLATLLQMVYNGTFVSPSASQVVLQALEGQTDNAGLAEGLPGNVWLAHKTGTLGTARNDAGIAEGDHPFVVAVMCGGAGFYESGANGVMAQIAATAYQDLAEG